MKNSRIMKNTAQRRDLCPPPSPPEVEREGRTIFGNGGYRPHTPENNRRFHARGCSCGDLMLNIAINRRDALQGRLHAGDLCPPLSPPEFEREGRNIFNTGGFRPHTPDSNKEYDTGMNACGRPLLQMVIYRRDALYGHLHICRPHTTDNHKEYNAGKNPCGRPLLQMAIPRTDARYGFMKNRKDYDV